MKIKRSYHEIIENRPKAVLIRLSPDAPAAVWFPRARIEIDEQEKTVAATEKLWAEKDAVGNRDFAAEKRERDGEMLPLTGAERHPGGKALVVQGLVEEDVSD